MWLTTSPLLTALSRSRSEEVTFKRSYAVVQDKWYFMLPGMLPVYDVARQHKHVLCCLYVKFNNIKTAEFKLSDVEGNIKHHLPGKTV